jgi:hypothetical protein
MTQNVSHNAHCLRRIRCLICVSPTDRTPGLFIVLLHDLSL